MADAKHTPGPWVIWGLNSKTGDLTIGIANETGPKKHIAELCWPKDEAQEPGGPTGLDDARLIAAAPDLLAALKALSFAAQTSGGVAGRDDALVDAIGVASRAIAKATGGSA